MGSLIRTKDMGEGEMCEEENEMFGHFDFEAPGAQVSGVLV